MVTRQRRKWTALGRGEPCMGPFAVEVRQGLVQSGRSGGRVRRN
jgi:hypothetical protein